MKLTQWMAGAVLALVAAGAGAQSTENAIRQAFAKKFENSMVVDSITRSPVPGLWEVVADGQVLYVDDKVNFIFRGALYDARGNGLKNLTAERTGAMVAKDLGKSHDLAIKRVRGNGKRVIYTFEDPNCGYCKELQKELNKVNDVTIYTFLVPIVNPPDSVEKSKAIWCAKDRAKAWDDLMNKGVMPSGDRNCDTPIEKAVQLAQRFGVRGTPAVYLANGQQIGGYLPADRIEQALAGR